MSTKPGRVKLSLLAGAVIVLLASWFWLRPSDNSIVEYNDSTETTTSQQTSENNDDTAPASQLETVIQPSNDPLTEKALAPQFGPQTFCSKLEKACFTYPPSWIKKIIDTSANKEEIHITSPDGTTLVWQYDSPSQLSGSCDTKPNALRTSLESISLPVLPGYYLITTGLPGTNIDHLGIIIFEGRVDLEGPEDPGLCTELYIPTFKSRQNPNILVSLRNLGYESMPIGGKDTLTALEIIKSFRYQ